MIARLAALRGDNAARRVALEQLVALSPGDPAAWDQLADLAAQDGNRDRLAELRRRKAQVDRALDDYRMLMGRSGGRDLSRAAELAQAAEVLGRRFETRGWWTIQARRQPDDGQAREALARLTGEKA
jgi:enediyne biosynthesis protein E4